jgi:hypothetical protein
MTDNPLRLVVDHETMSTRSVDLPPAGPGGLHIHLHVGAPDQRQQHFAPGPDADEKGRSGRGYRRPLLLGVAGILIALVAFDLGARSGEGHARALAAARTNAEGLASLAPGAQQQQLNSPGDLPAVMRQQLAQQPTITPPPGTAATAGMPDPFGLQH